MTELEWMACGDYERLLPALLGRASPRKMRLVACGWCRLHWHDLADPDSRRAVEVGERFADGLATGEERQREFLAACGASASLALAGGGGHNAAAWADSCVNADAAAWASAAEGCHHGAEERAAVAALLREVAGNPFRRAPRGTGWLTPAVAALAVAAYEERSLPSGELDLARLCVLADALEEAGCSDAELLGHLRGPGPHVRGCWALDLILGKG